MNSSSLGSRLASYVPLACLAIAVASSAVALALARNAVPIRGEGDPPVAVAMANPRLATDNSRSGGEAPAGEAHAVRPAGDMANADLSAGFRIARDICSACHIVQPGQPGGVVLVHPGPAFQEIANRRDTTRESLTAFIQGTSGDMAALPVAMSGAGLSERSTDQVVSYILSLANEPEG